MLIVNNLWNQVGACVVTNFVTIASFYILKTVVRLLNCIFVQRFKISNKYSKKVNM